MRACAHDGHAWTRNALEIARMQLAMCRQCALALMMKVRPGLATHRKLIACNMSPMRACTYDPHAWTLNAMEIDRAQLAMCRACSYDGHACIGNCPEFDRVQLTMCLDLQRDRMQLAMCCRCAHALMTVTPGVAMHRKLIASNLRCVADARMF